MESPRWAAQSLHQTPATPYRSAQIVIAKCVGVQGMSAADRAVAEPEVLAAYFDGLVAGGVEVRAAFFRLKV